MRASTCFVLVAKSKTWMPGPPPEVAALESKSRAFARRAGHDEKNGSFLTPRTPLSFWESGAWVEGAVERRQPKNRTAFFSPDNGRRVPRGWLVPQNECRRWDRHRRSRRGCQSVPKRKASQPTYGSAALSQSTRKFGRRIKRHVLKHHLKTSFPGFRLFVIRLLQSAGPHEATGRVVSHFKKLR